MGRSDERDERGNGGGEPSTLAHPISPNEIQTFDDRRLVDELCVAANQTSGDWTLLREEMLTRLACLREKVVDLDASHANPMCTGCRRPREAECRNGCIVDRCGRELTLREAS